MTTEALRHTQSTILKKTSEINITRSKCIITFMIDLKPYEDLLKQLEDKIEQANEDRKGLSKY